MSVGDGGARKADFAHLRLAAQERMVVDRTLAVWLPDRNTQPGTGQGVIKRVVIGSRMFHSVAGNGEKAVMLSQLIQSAHQSAVAGTAVMCRFQKESPR